MQTAQLIATEIFCTHYQAEVSFVRTLHQSGLIELVVVDETEFIPEDELQKLEKLVRLHYDLHINVEGIETINHLLSKIEIMQQEMLGLRNRLSIYEGE